MPAIAKLGDLSSGHDGFPPSRSISTPISSVFIDGVLPLGVGSIYESHNKGNAVHLSNTRVITAGSSTIFFDGIAVARTGDPISCGDTVGPGSESSSSD